MLLLSIASAHFSGILVPGFMPAFFSIGITLINFYSLLLSR